jgi:hypothetical protein
MHRSHLLLYLQSLHNRAVLGLAILCNTAASRVYHFKFVSQAYDKA